MKKYIALASLAITTLLIVGCTQSTSTGVEQSSSPVPVPTTTDALNHYTNANFSISYPNAVTLQTESNITGGNLDTPVAKFLLPQTTFKAENTNFREGFVVVSKSTKADVVKTCIQFLNAATTDTEPKLVMINGNQFSKVESSDAGAGNFYQGNLYRIVYDNTCYEMAEIIHTTNAMNYDPPMQEFNKAEALNILDPIVNSFTFAS